MKSIPEIHLKGWGRELWIANNENYCGKILQFKKGMRCSFHFHRLKSETFFCSKGKIVIHYSYEDDLEKAKSLILNEGEYFDVPVGMRHQMRALEDTDLFEFSTEHFETDSYRIVKGD